jgi:hypothetical protein
MFGFRRIGLRYRSHHNFVDLPGLARSMSGVHLSRQTVWYMHVSLLFLTSSAVIAQNCISRCVVLQWLFACFLKTMVTVWQGVQVGGSAKAVTTHEDVILQS